MNKPLLSVNNLTHLYAPGKGFSDVSFDLWPGEVLGIVGESGSGKTTLLKSISARLTPQQGEIHYESRSLYAMSVPTTFEAAEASRKHGMNVLMGAPNIVRGGSHSGNVAASELAQLGLLDILSSDYYPASLLDAAFRVADDESNRFTLPQAVRLVTKNPAQALNLQDRGVIGEGKRADLVLAHRQGNHIHIDHVWRQGKRVF
ncbi:ATP-binding cassette domain-containing protein [Escherichia coli]|uniref:ATP-binding cassette domain-containing protein n=1 Tax=Escherichia coli TaxID=562 RepID=UPI00222840E2|nr:ATP-binding cassette domain-containing protein [Escherichia coli]MCW3276894.1 ATP-binding cassette domain-containing protein [Escherichia coli]